MYEYTYERRNAKGEVEQEILCGYSITDVKRRNPDFDFASWRMVWSEYID